jgi:hypothetical protein
VRTVQWPSPGLPRARGAARRLVAERQWRKRAHEARAAVRESAFAPETWQGRLHLGDGAVGKQLPLRKPRKIGMLPDHHRHDRRI